MPPHATSTAEMASSSIPVVDLSQFTTDATLQERISIARSLVEACQTVGFVYIRGHGVSETDLARAFTISKTFYDLPLDQKMKAPHPPGWAVHRGYSWPGFEKVSDAVGAQDGQVDVEEVKKLREVTDCKESYEIGSENNLDMPNIWPPDDFPLPEFRDFMTSFYWTCFEASKKILRALALGIGLAEDDLLKLHSGHYNQLRLLHYPPVPAKALEDGHNARMPAHTDWSIMTILFQDDCGGLQVEDAQRPGKFIDVEPIAGTLVMNVGDLMMRWSNDTLISTRHRVTLPPLQDRFSGDDRTTRARYSIPYFVTTDPDLLVKCMSSCSDEEHPPKYTPITNRAYSAMRASMQY